MTDEALAEIENECLNSSRHIVDPNAVEQEYFDIVPVLVGEVRRLRKMYLELLDEWRGLDIFADREIGQPGSEENTEIEYQAKKAELDA